MSNDTANSSRNPGSPDPLGEQIARAGARARAPEYLEAQVRVAVERAWLETVQARRRRTVVRWALAASVAALSAVVMLSLKSSRVAADDLTVGTVLATRGKVSLVAAGAGESAVHLGAIVPTNALLRVPVDGAARLAMVGATLSIQGDSELVFDAPAAIRLQRGRIYVDGVRDARVADRVRVITPFGSVEHLGTRFEVAVTASGLRVRVRDGQVRVLGIKVQQTLHGSDQLSISASGEVTGGFLPTFSDEWAWTQDPAANINIDGKSLIQFLDWFARESGYAVRFSSARAQQAAAAAVLHGSIAGMSVRSSLEVVIASTNLQFELTPLGECRISLRNEMGTGA